MLVSKYHKDLTKRLRTVEDKAILNLQNTRERHVCTHLEKEKEEADVE